MNNLTVTVQGNPIPDIAVFNDDINNIPSAQPSSKRQNINNNNNNNNNAPINKSSKIRINNIPDDDKMEEAPEQPKKLSWGERTNLFVGAMKEFRISNAIKQLRDFIPHSPTIELIRANITDFVSNATTDE